MIGLLRALRVEGRRVDSRTHSMHHVLSARTGTHARSATPLWRSRLARATNFVDRDDAVRHLEEVVAPALAEVAEELCSHGVETLCETDAGGETPSVVLRTAHEEDARFLYEVRLTEATVPTYGGRMVQARDTYWRLEVFLTEGGQGYDVMGYSQEQVIDDCLDQYERHLEFLRLAEPTTF
jgi:choline/glycine/proline betaine transport protein